ncbi:MAG: mnmA [Candidatus Saccharibacteria bacterium]|nr:mnmA [Candidatus Saccharibacteria bacterium]
MRVYVGMSGGVDSSLTAALLVEQGYDVTGVYMKNWTQDLPGMKCPWADDLADAKRVAVQLGIDFKVFDFEKEYKHKVVDYMIDEYKRGRTPNPDIMCNQEVKFKLFLEAALEDGADTIATGHYARVEEGVLKQAVDTNKDQTYFLYRVTGEALAKTLFPLGQYTKPQVRAMATERGLSTAAKKDSQGICFVGKIGIREFLSEYVQQTPGDIIDTMTEKVIGRHDGAIFYTLGQRHGLDVGGGLPYYVVGKDMDKNEVYVTTDLNDNTLWKNEIHLQELHWINQPPVNAEYIIRVRHRAPLVRATLADSVLSLANPERAVTAGQSVVIYDGETCLGGGIVA